MTRRFENRVVLVSGATSGIGEAAAHAFAAHGARVFGIGRSAEAIDRASGRLPGVEWLRADLSLPDDPARAVDELRRKAGQVDVLVNNAGIFLPAPLGAASAAATSATSATAAQVATNVVGLIELTRAALPLLRPARGTVVNVSSAVARKAAPGISVYAATKAAVESLTRSWALELAPEGIRVNAIAPGPVATPAFEKTGLPPEAVAALGERLVSSLPLGRIASPDEVARWILHLADADWMTGSVLAFDGGMSLA